jgi:hypothetical protein
LSNVDPRSGAHARNASGVSPTWWNLAPWLAIAVIASAVGLVARFKGLAAPSLAVDEYFIVQSVRNVLRTGWPAFDCGGWYQRGLLLQYLSAGLQLLGVSEPLAPRLIAALSSVLALPAVFGIARRAYNPTVGLIAVSLLLVSLWEIEIARFGRMYTPFQAITAWYALYFLRYTVDRKAGSFLAMVVLSFLGILTWEGGVLLAAANLLPLLLRRDPIKFSAAFAGKLVGLVLLAAFGYWLAVANLRAAGPDVLPVDYTGDTFEVYAGLFDLAPNYLPTIFEKPLWLVLGVVPLIAAAFALRSIVALRSRPLAAFGLLLVVAAVVCGQLVAAVTVLVLLVVFRFVDWVELRSPSMRAFWLGLVVCTLFWLVFVAVSFDWQGIETGSLLRGTALFAYQFARFPNLVNVAVWPWARSVPILGFVLLVVLSAAVLRVTLRSGAEPLTAERALLALVLSMLVFAAMSSPPRIETRYTFFLYPLVVVLGVGVLWSFCAARVRAASVASALAGASAFGILAMTEDFDIDHLRHLVQPAVPMAAALPDNLQEHFVGRGDDAALVRWLDASVVPDRDIVITGYHVLDYYYPKVAYFFVDHRDDAFGEWSCHRGTTERWTNKPMLYTIEGLEAAIPERGRAFVVVFDDGGHLLSELSGVSATVVWSMEGIQVIRMERS